MPTENLVETHYPSELQKTYAQMEALGKNIPKVMGAFMKLHGAGAAKGALDSKTKEIIALAIAVVCRCDGCIGFHTHDAIEAGASKQEIMDAMGVAIVMGGGPSVMYATHVMEAYDQYMKEKGDK